MSVVKLREPFIIATKQLELGTTCFLLQYFTPTTTCEQRLEKSLSDDEDQSIENLFSLLHMGSFYIGLRCCSSLLANKEYLSPDDIIFGGNRRVTDSG